MNKELKNFIKKTKADLGEDHSTVRGTENFHRRLKAAALISKDVFGKVEVPPATILAFYEAIVKEEMASIWMERVLGQAVPLPPKAKKESVITEAPDGIVFNVAPDKLSN